MPKRYLVIGKSGQVGKSLQKLIKNASTFRTAGINKVNHDNFTFVGREEIDLTKPQSILDFFLVRSKAYDVIINCAAYTAVDQANSEPELADHVNHLAVRQLAEIAKSQEALFVHISTDYVFDGYGYLPYIESDRASPQNTYGSTKLKGEQAIQKSGCIGIIIRTSWVYSEFGNNFVKTMLKLGRSQDSLRVIMLQI